MRRRGVHERLGFGGHSGQRQHDGLGWNVPPLGSFETQQNRINEFQGQTMFQQDVTRNVNLGNIDNMATFSSDRRQISNIGGNLMGTVQSIAPNAALNMDISSPMPLSIGQMMNIGAQLSAANSNLNRDQTGFAGAMCEARPPQQVGQRFVLPRKRTSGDNNDFMQKSNSFKRRSQGYTTSSSDVSSSQPSEKGGFRCQVCKVHFASIEEFDSHMASRDHSANMGMISTVYNDTNKHLLKTAHFGGQNESKPGFCTVCDRSFGNVSEAYHNESKEHKRRHDLAVNGCRFCSVKSFQHYNEFLRHIASESHKKKKAELNQSSEGPKATTSSRINIRNPSSDGPKATSSTRNNILNRSSDESKTTTSGVKNSGSKTNVIGSSPATREVVGRSGDMKKKQLITTTKPKVAAITSGADSPTQSEVPASVETTIAVEKSVDTPLSAVKYNPDTAVAVDEVISVTGYFCKLCHKFYNNETMARVTHCKSQAHFDKYYESLRDKQKQSGAAAGKTEPDVEEVTTTRPEQPVPKSTSATVKIGGATVKLGGAMGSDMPNIVKTINVQRAVRGGSFRGRTFVRGRRF